MTPRTTTEHRTALARGRRRWLPSALALVLAVGALVVMAARDARAAQTNSIGFAVAAAVNVRCSLAVSPLGFGAYTGATLDVATTIVVNCGPGGRRARIALGQGLYPAAGSTAANPLRRMLGPAGTYLGYQIYQDAARTLVWNDVSPGVPGPGAPQAYPKTWDVYGRLPGAQVTVPGMYNDMVLVTLDF